MCILWLTPQTNTVSRKGHKSLATYGLLRRNRQAHNRLGFRCICIENINILW